MEVQGFLPLARRWWWLLIVVAVVAGVAAHLVSARLTPTYEAEVSLITGPINTDFTTLRASGDLARTYGQLATTRPIIGAAKEELGLDAPVDVLRESVRATANSVTRLVTIRARSDDAGMAATLANTIAKHLVTLPAAGPQRGQQQVVDLMRQPELVQLPLAAQRQARVAANRVLGAAPLEGRLLVVDPATPPAVAVAPRRSLIVVLAVLGAMAAVAVFVLIRESARDTVGAEEMLADVPVPFLGSVNSLPATFSIRGSERELVVESAPESRAAEAYRLVAARLGLTAVDQGVRKLLVVPAGEGDGAGVVAANIAAAIAEVVPRVILIDANVVEGDATKLLGLASEPGYAELLDELEREGADVRLDQFMVVRDSGLCIVPVGRRGAILREPHVADRIVARLASAGDIVIVTAPPLDRSASSLLWTQAVDATLLVAQRGRTSRERLAYSTDLLNHIRVNVVGTVLAERRRLGAAA